MKNRPASETEVKASTADTWRHIHHVQTYLLAFCGKLQERVLSHDQSKLEPPEAEVFALWTPRIAETSYGSPEYQKAIEGLGPALAHHYAKNRHHPEHWPNGVEDMSLVDLVEMFCDWKAASDRQHEGNLRKTIEHNADRFRLPPLLVRVLKNTIDEI